MKQAFTGVIETDFNPLEAYQKTFAQLAPNTRYWDPTSGLDLRPLAGFKSNVDLKAATTTQGGAGTAGYAMIPVYLDPMIVDKSRKRTPLVELIPRVTNMGMYADWNTLETKGSAATKFEDAVQSETDDTTDRNSVAIKFLYSVGRVTGPLQAAQPAYVLQGFQGTGAGLGGSAFGDVSAPNAMQLRILTAAKALKELEENLILNGDATTDSTQFSGIVKLQGTTNQLDKNSGALSWNDVEDAVQYAFDDGGQPKLAVGSSSAVTDVRKIIIDLFRYDPSNMPNGVLPFGVPAAIVLHTLVGPIPLIPSMYLSNTSGAKQIYFLDTDYIEMRVLQDMTYEKLAKTNDSEKFYLKIYECLVMKNPAFNSFIDNIA